MILLAMAGKTRIVQVVIRSIKTFAERQRFFQSLVRKSYSVSHKLSIIYLWVWWKVKNPISIDGAYIPWTNWFLLIEGNRLTGHGWHLYTPGLFQRSLLALGRVAQLGEHRPYKPGVTGSSPVPPTI